MNETKDQGKIFLNDEKDKNSSQIIMGKSIRSKESYIMSAGSFNFFDHFGLKIGLCIVSI